MKTKMSLLYMMRCDNSHLTNHWNFEDMVKMVATYFYKRASFFKSFKENSYYDTKFHY